MLDDPAPDPEEASLLIHIVQDWLTRLASSSAMSSFLEFFMYCIFFFFYFEQGLLMSG